MMPREELTIAPSPSSLKKWTRSAPLPPLCAVAGHENVGLRHHLAQRLAHFRIGCANNRTNIAIFAAHALAAPFGNLFTDDFIQRSAVHQTILELTTAGVGSFTSTKMPLFSSLQTFMNGLMPSEPRYGFTVAKSSSKGA